MNCKICDHDNRAIFKGKILNKYSIDYYHCAHCGFLQTEEPYWLEEAYAESINLSDTGYMQRNLTLSNKLSIFLPLLFNKDDQFLDYAGGYGVFVRLMRDIGFDFYWDDKFTSNLFARGFEYQQQQDVKAITTFESFEHYVNPLEDIEKMLTLSTMIIFSTELLPANIPKTAEWWYYGLEHGQHISFYSELTFQFIANKYKLNYYNFGSFHVLSAETIPVWMKYMVKLSKLGVHQLFKVRLKGRTWDDYLQMSDNLKAASSNK